MGAYLGRESVDLSAQQCLDSMRLDRAVGLQGMLGGHLSMKCTNAGLEIWPSGKQEELSIRLVESMKENLVTAMPAPTATTTVVKMFLRAIGYSGPEHSGPPQDKMARFIQTEIGRGFREVQVYACFDFTAPDESISFAFRGEGRVVTTVTVVVEPQHLRRITAVVVSDKGETTPHRELYDGAPDKGETLRVIGALFELAMDVSQKRPAK